MLLRRCSCSQRYIATMALQRVATTLLLFTMLHCNDGCAATCCCDAVVVRNVTLQRWLHYSIAMVELQHGDTTACNTPMLVWKCCNAMLRRSYGSVAMRCCGVSLVVLQCDAGALLWQCCSSQCVALL